MATIVNGRACVLPWIYTPWTTGFSWKIKQSVSCQIKKKLIYRFLAPITVCRVESSLMCRTLVPDRSRWLRSQTTWKTIAESTRVCNSNDMNIIGDFGPVRLLPQPQPQPEYNTYERTVYLLHREIKNWCAGTDVSSHFIRVSSVYFRTPLVECSTNDERLVNTS